MAPLTAWLPVRSERIPDLVVTLAGAGPAGLAAGATTLEEILSGQGYRVMGGRGPDRGRTASVRLRVSTEPISSLGAGCDVVVCVDRHGLQAAGRAVQPGGVLVCEPDTWSPTAGPPPGVVAYGVPFRKLRRQCGFAFDGRGLIAAGVLTHLLGIPEASAWDRVRPRVGLRYFAAGLRFAAAHLEKRDILGLPALAEPVRQVLLTARQAQRLALGLGRCECGNTCQEALDRSPAVWLERHLKQLWAAPPAAPWCGVSVLRGWGEMDRDVGVVLGVTDPTSVVVGGTGRPSLVVVAGSLKDVLGLTAAARRASRARGEAVWVVADRLLTDRQESLPVQQLLALVEEASRTDPHASGDPVEDRVLEGDEDWEPGAEVGYVTWGAAQGVVREAVTLCRSFGLKVAALYPKVLWPVPERALTAFAGRVARLVVVEPDRAGRYTRLIRQWTAIPVSSVAPAPGEELTPLDLFLREDLGV
ncbi:2-oxoacid:acceptor oxidoreductase family protein [Nitrospira sp. Kam-Ns4a]